jgi:hypothetical protein
MDHRGPEHHYDEVECPECGTFWQQGEIQPETVRNSCPECGYDLRSSTGGRPYRGQPSDINSEMTERNTLLDGASGDRGGNPLGEGIFAGLKDKMDWEEIAELDEATEPAGLGETHPVKDNQWKPGDKGSPMGRDEMLGSVRNSGEHSWGDPGDDDNQELWDQVVEDFENAKAEPHQSASKIATAPWLDETPDGFPVEQLGWDIVEVVEPSKELTEAVNKYSMPMPEGITDNLHEALIAVNAWVENPEENGKLRPYKEYWSVIRPKITQGNVKIGVEDPHMADIINDVARTNSLSSLNKTSNELEDIAGGLAAAGAGAALIPGVDVVATPLLEGAAGVAEGAGLAAEALGAGEAALGAGEAAAGAAGAGEAAAGAAGAGEAAGESAAAGEGKSIFQKGIDMAQKHYRNKGIKDAIFGDDEEDDESTNGSGTKNKTIDPYDAMKNAVDNFTPPTDVVQPMSLGYLGHTISTYGEGYESPSSISERHADPISGSSGIDPHQLSDQDNSDALYGLQDVNGTGSTNDPRGKDDAKERHQRQVVTYDKESLAQFGPSSMVPRNGMPPMPDATLTPQQPKPNVIDPSTHGFDPQSGPASAAGASAGWETQTSPNLIDKTAPLSPQEQQQAQQLNQKNQQQQQQAQQQIMQQIQQKKKGSKTQGPHTDEQQNAFIEHLHEMFEAGELDEEQVAQLEDMMFNEPSNPEVTKIWSEIANQDELFDAAPEDMAPSPQEQMQGMGAPGMPPAPGGDMGMGGPPGPAGPAPGIPDMSAPTPADLNPAGPGAMPPPIMSSVRDDMLKSVLKYAADSAASTCPKCDGHTTGVVNQSTGGCECRSCGHKWDDKNLIPSDGTSTDTSTTSSFYQALNLDEGPMEVMPGSVDSFNEPEELEEDDSTHTWADDSGEPLQEGKEYEIYAHNYEIPDVGRVVEVKPDSIVYEIESNGGLRTTIEIDRQEADLNGYRFVSTDFGSEDNPAGIEENMDSKNVTAPGQDSDLSTPHIQIGSSTKNATVGFWACPETPACQFNIEGGDFEPGECPYHHVPTVEAGENYMQQIYTVKEYQEGRNVSSLKTAGQHYTPMQQRELIDEYGEARNADKLNLEGTHYADSDPDYFLFGC